MAVIFFVLRTGSQWQALRATGICSPSSAYRRFREGTDAGGSRNSGAKGFWPTMA